MASVVILEDLRALVAGWRNQGLRIGFTCGAFDLLHAGHANYLSEAKNLCDRLVVAVNSDDSIRSYKDKDTLRPIVSQEHRAALVAALASVDAVTIMHEDRPAHLIQALRPDLYVKGGDYKVAELRSAPLVESYGGQCAVIPVEYEISTSDIIHRIQELHWYSPPSEIGNAAAMPLVFLDRDGTLIDNVHFLNDPARVKLLAGVGEGLRALQDAGYRLIVISNQQGIGLGYFDYDVFVRVNSEMMRQLSSFGVRISRFYFCPHTAADDCKCRKPGSELVERALRDYAAAPSDCWMIGDRMSDVIAAERAGCNAVLLSPSAAVNARTTTHIANDFPAAVELVLIFPSRAGSQLSRKKR